MTDDQIKDADTRKTLEGLCAPRVGVFLILLIACVLWLGVGITIERVKTLERQMQACGCAQ